MKKIFGTAVTILFALILMIVAAAAHAQQLHQNDGLVFDARGKLVAQVIGPGPSPAAGGGGAMMSSLVAFTIERKFFAVYVTRNRFFGTSSPLGPPISHRGVPLQRPVSCHVVTLPS